MTLARAEIGPTAHEVINTALTIAEAAVGNPGRAKHIAFEAIKIAFPDWSTVRLGLQLHYKQPRHAQSVVNHSKSQLWWSEIAVDEIVGVLVADQYGERAN